MITIATREDKAAFEAEMAWRDRWSARTLYEQLCQTAERHGDRPALTFQLKSGPKDKAVTLSWRELRERVTQAANLMRRLGIGERDVVAYILPNCLEAPIALLAGATAGIVSPINPLLAIDTIAGILRDTGAKAVVTLAPFPRTDLAQRVGEAVALVPEVSTIIEVDLRPYVEAPMSWMIPFVRPKLSRPPKARFVDLARAMAEEPGDRLSFEETGDDRFCAYFHTGGTTGLPKVAQHRPSGILYNGWCGTSYMFTEQHVLICPLPMFHVFAAYPVLISCVMSGAHMVMVTPQGYRGHGVFQNFWKLVERHRVTFLITVPTAAAVLMQRDVDADVSSLQYAISGSAAMPVELFRKFEATTGVRIMEGYGLTEATCLVSLNPPAGERKIGSVGLPFPYTDVRILACDVDGEITHECGVDEVGEICVRNPGTTPGETYVEPEKNRGLYTPDGFLRTGDLGRIDADGYVWITGRAKDLIIRGGHNIDPAVIEEALMRRPEVAFAGAIGQPDVHSGEVPAVYVELCADAHVSVEQLLGHARDSIGERAAVPKHLEVLPELPKTAVGKVFKPELRKLAIRRVYNQALAEAGMEARVAEVIEDKKRGLVAVLDPGEGPAGDPRVEAVLGAYLTPWMWRG
jgi:fatty-acyl-CoA synthase